MVQKNLRNHDDDTDSFKVNMACFNNELYYLERENQISQILPLYKQPQIKFTEQQKVERFDDKSEKDCVCLQSD